MRFLFFTIALIALAIATFFLGGVNVIAACVLGGIGFAAIVGWAALG